MELKLSSGNQRGFTFAEIAVAIVITGLLIGCFIKGMELIENSQMNAGISQIKSIESGYTIFKDAYQAIPGDLQNANSVLTSCITKNVCVNGNGNRIVGATSQAYKDITPAMESENSQFWKHLALAGMISGVSGGATSAKFGESHPNTGILGGLFVKSVIPDAVNSNGFTIQNLMIVSRNNVSGNWCGESLNCSVSPSLASKIDIKIDDGAALSGNVQAVSHLWQKGCGQSSFSGQDQNGYNADSGKKTCDIMFVLR